MKNHVRSERHFRLDENIARMQAKRIPPPPVRTVPSLWVRLLRLLGLA
jgi:hypothetical protein